MIDEEDYNIVDAMEKYGGSFVRALAEAARRADPINFLLIKNTWPEYWRQYQEIAKKNL